MDIDKFKGGNMDVIYQADDQYFDFFEEQVKELQAKKNQGIKTSVLLALTGSRHKMRRRQVTGIPLTTVMMDTATPVTVTDVQATTKLLVPVKTIPGSLMPVPVTVIPMQPPIVESQLGGSYINNLQVHHDSSNISRCSSDSDAQQNIKSHFIDRSNDKILTTFKELFSNVNIDSVCEILPKINK